MLRFLKLTSPFLVGIILCAGLVGCGSGDDGGGPIPDAKSAAPDNTGKNVQKGGEAAKQGVD